MKIEIKQPHEDYPYAHVHIGVGIDTERIDLVDILAKNNLTLLGPWKLSIEKDISTFAAPVLLEDQHTKPRKKAPAKRVRVKNLPG